MNDTTPSSHFILFNYKEYANWWIIQPLHPILSFSSMWILVNIHWFIWNFLMIQPLPHISSFWTALDMQIYRCYNPFVQFYTFKSMFIRFKSVDLDANQWIIHPLPHISSFCLIMKVGTFSEPCQHLDRKNLSPSRGPPLDQKKS